MINELQLQDDFACNVNMNDSYCKMRITVCGDSARATVVARLLVRHHSLTPSRSFILFFVRGSPADPTRR